MVFDKDEKLKLDKRKKRGELSTTQYEKNFGSNIKYLTRCHYYGKLLNWDYICDGSMVLVFNTYTATEYYGNNCTIRVYVPTALEHRLANELTVGDSYYLITAPYRVQFHKTYKHRVDLLLNIFKEVI